MDDKNLSTTQGTPARSGVNAENRGVISTAWSAVTESWTVLGNAMGGSSGQGQEDDPEDPGPVPAPVRVRVPVPIQVPADATETSEQSESEEQPKVEANKSVGVNAKLSLVTDKRTRIDNLGGYHEYQSYPARAKAEALVIRTLNEKKVSGTIKTPTASPGFSPATSRHESMSCITDIRGYMPDGPVSITPIIGTTHLFIPNPCKVCSEVPPEFAGLGVGPIREVMNDLNRRIFFLAQTKGTSWIAWITLFGLIRQSFTFTITDKNGKPALYVDGIQYLFGLVFKSTIKYPDGTLLASVKQAVCDGSYKIYDERSRVIFTVVGPVFACYAPCVFCCCDEEFEMFFSGSADEVGRIGKYWSKEQYPQTQATFGLSFPASMAVRSKAIVFGAAISIRYQYFVKGGNAVFLVPLYMILVLASLLLYTGCFGHCEFYHK